MRKKKLCVAYLDNTVPKKKVKTGYRRGETDDRLSGLKKAEVNGISIKPVIIDPYPFPINPLRHFHSLYAGIDVIRAFRVLFSIKRFDAILAVGESSAMVFLILKSIFKLKTPVLLIDPPVSLEWKIRKRILDVVLPRADRILVLGHNQVDFIKKVWGEKCKPVVLPQVIDTSSYRPLQVKSENYIFSIGDDIGRDFPLLIKASAEIGVDVSIRTKECNMPGGNLPKNVSLIKNRVSFQELKELYGKSSFVVIPLVNCQHASGVNSVIESMAMGKATIVSASDGIKDYVINNETGLLVEPGNKKQLINTMKHLIETPEETARIGRNARLAVEKKFNIESRSRRLISIIVESVKESNHKIR